MEDYPASLTFAGYQAYAARFAVDRERVLRAMARCNPLAIEALAVYGWQHIWQGELPVYPVMTTPEENGGWGHLMPVWFKPYERPVPLYVLQNWALFALVYASSFGPAGEARRLLRQAFTVDNLVHVVVGTNLLIPFLPTTQGRGVFLRHGMLPFLLAILWLEQEASQAWLRLHELGAHHFIAAHGLHRASDPAATLADLEFAVFATIERNRLTNDAAVAALLAGEPDRPSEAATLLRLYRDLFGAICLGVAALAAQYQKRPLEAWRAWAPQEIGVAYRMSDYAVEAIQALVRRWHG